MNWIKLITMCSRKIQNSRCSGTLVWLGWTYDMGWKCDLWRFNDWYKNRKPSHIPDSLRWKIQLWTLADCCRFCQEELPADISGVTIRDIEPKMIRKLSPALNVYLNLHPGKDTTPLSNKEKQWEKFVDQSYDEIFNKKK